MVKLRIMAGNSYYLSMMKMMRLLCFAYMFAIYVVHTEEAIEDEVGGMPREWANNPPCEDPWPPMNADLHCGVHLTMENTFICKATCRQGFQYPKGDFVLKHYCNLTSLKWAPEFEFPDCVEICTPACENNGTCAEGNVCICKPKYRGDRCQFSTSACNPHEALSTLAEWHCDHTLHESVCTLNCPENTEYEYHPESIYKCSLDGVWTPSIAPKCLPINVIQHDKQGLFSAPTVKVLEPPATASCAAWNQLHYRTFDNAFYHFEGPCTYVLAKDCTHNAFSIHVKHSVVYVITIYIGSDPYMLTYLEGIPIVSFEDKTFPVPTSLHGMMFEKISDYVSVSSSLGFRIKWNEKYIVLNVDSQLRNKTCGLCGRFDGNVANDFEMVDGAVTANIEAFVNSWTMEDLLESKCEQGAVVQQQCSDGDVMEKAEVACKVLMDPKFSICHSILDPTSYLETCKLDYCACAKSEDSCICDSLSQYFQECIRRGGKLEGGWRNDQLCPLLCPEGMTYEDCGSSCPKTCRDTVYDCEDNHCVDGCHCPSGTVLHNELCIPKDNCPCIHKQKEYRNGERYEQDCNACECHMGKWQCTSDKCEAQCSSVGDPHFTTFDGRKYEYLATCPVYLVYHNNFTIIQETVPCSLIGGSTQVEGMPSSKFCTKSITISYDISKLVLKHGTNPSFNMKDVLSLPFTEDGIRVYEASSLFTKVELPNQLSLMWDGENRIYIDVPSSLFGQTKGLCGTFNNNQKDDFTTPDGDIEADILTFASRWQASDSCHKRSRRSEANPCIQHPQNVKLAETYCTLLKDDIFSRCHSEVDHEPFYKNCVLDLCSCQQELADCICPIFADYSSICSKKGIILDWAAEIDTCSLTCETGKVYQECNNPCLSSCTTISSIEHCKETCVQGCACPEGTTLNAESACIPINECPCMYEGKDFAAGSTAVQGTSICSCKNARWECRQATMSELANADIMIDDQPVSCSADRHEEFRSCSEKCPVTCKNLHVVQNCETKICRPACSCMEGYVLDEDSGRCVKSSECGCQHGNQKYLEGQKIQKECNLCTCTSGSWQCSEKMCPEQCTAWGASHYRTFDGLIYDFHGNCDYILASGKQGKTNFIVSQRNIPCSGNGLTCSKSFAIDLNMEDKLSKLVLEKNKPLPKNKYDSPFVTLEAGLFVLIYTNIGVSLRWDRGTRIYLTLDPRWRHKVTGLCGNFNDDQADDFQTPSGGMPEIQPVAFADSWKIRDSCPASTPAFDTCSIHPNRQAWANQKCSILKSSLFAPCHSAVTLEPYYDRCIFDTCACDEGGDCECLCTAIATYAHECNNQGVHIKWRTQELCPIQCEECSTYDSCMPSCPKKTCLNQYMYSYVEDACIDDICVEGCNPKPCPPGEIFNNGKEYKCIPESECVVPCMEINGKWYNEGERIADPSVGDSCQSCHCLRGKPNCTGDPCSTTTTTAQPPSPNTNYKCKQTGWTPYFNSYSNVGGDYESLENPSLVRRLAYYCSTWNVSEIECRDSESKRSPEEIGQNVLCSVEHGLVCHDRNQVSSVCKDYEIRLFCNCGERVVTTLKPFDILEKCTNGWTPWMSGHIPENSGEVETYEVLRKSFSFCSKHQIKAVECRSKRTWENPLQNDKLDVECSVENGFRCKHTENQLCEDYEIRFRCKCEEETCVPGWTNFFNTDHPEENPEHEDEETIEKITKLYPVCTHGKITDIQCTTILNDEIVDYKETGQFGLKCSKNLGFVCNSFLQAKGQRCYDYAVRFYCSCEAVPTPATPTTIKPIITTTYPCPPDEVYDSCAYQCDQSCQGFAHKLSCSSNNNCVAGCRPIGGCNPPFLWRDFKNCVPMDECTCIISIDEEIKIVAPNEIVSSEEFCGKCQCIDNKMHCTDCPVTTSTVTPLPPITSEYTRSSFTGSPENMICWTQWMNIDNPESGGGDFEMISFVRNHYKFCLNPTMIECRTVGDHKTPSEIGQSLTCDLKSGLNCWNADNGIDGCHDYEIRFYCPCGRALTTPIPKSTTLKPTIPTSTAPEITTMLTTTSFIPSVTTENLECWTEWMNIDTPEAGGGDFETLSFIRNEFDFCMNPTKIECRTVKDHKLPFEIGQILTCDLKSGLNCWNADNGMDGCYDYEVRFYCPCGQATTTPTPKISTILSTSESPTVSIITENAECWTEWMNTDNPESGGGDFETMSFVRNEFDFCSNPIKIECRTVDSHKLSSEIGQNLACDVRSGLGCWNADNGIDGCYDYEIRFSCPCEPIITTPKHSTPTTVTKEPTTTSPIPSFTPTAENVECWTEWMNIDNPESGGGDFETLSFIRNEFDFCANPTKIECRTVGDHKSSLEVDQNLACDLKNGLNCWNADNDRDGCYDYEIRFYCPCVTPSMPTTSVPTPVSPKKPICWTEWMNIDNPESGGGDFESTSFIRNQYDFCSDPVKIECRSVDEHKKPFEIGQNADCNVESGLNCWNADNGIEGCRDYEVRFFCPCETTTVKPSTTIEPSICVDGWTEWFNSHQPNSKGESETVQSVRAKGGLFCSSDMISTMECRKKHDLNKTPLQYGVVCDLLLGLQCFNGDFRGGESCFDYEVRFYCDCPIKTPPPVTTSSPTPPSATSTAIPVPTTPEPRAPDLCDYWSEWINERHPSKSLGTKGVKGVKGRRKIVDDVERQMLVRLQEEENFCRGGYLSDIECRAANLSIDYTETGDKKLVCSLASGFKCRGRDQRNGICHDYMIRYFCSCKIEPTIRPTVTTTSVPACQEYYQIIDGPYPLPDSSFTASSSFNFLTGPEHARLSTTHDFNSAGAWIALDTSYQYLDIDLGEVQLVYGVITKGQEGGAAWVKSYKIMYSEDKSSFSFIIEDPKLKKPKIFSGNFDSNTPVEHLFERPFKARYVRIYPLTFMKEIALRVDFLGCVKGTTTRKIVTTPPTPVCTDPMGMEKGSIDDSQIKFSSARDKLANTSSVRLNTKQVSPHPGAWVSDILDQHQYVEVNFCSPRTVTAVVTQGRDLVNQWVTAFTISYSVDGVIWNYILDKGEPKIFAGNHDSDTPQTHIFPQPVRAKFLRVNPRNWENWISLRLEILGCYEPYECIHEYVITTTSPDILPEVCGDKMGLEKQLLPDSFIEVSSSALLWSGASRIRLNTHASEEGTGGWVPNPSDYMPSVLINFNGKRNVSGVITQGREDSSMWVKSYRVQYSLDNITWYDCLDGLTSGIIFGGNHDRNTPQTRLFEEIVEARFIKITILDYHNLPALRLELLGCYEPYSFATTVSPVITTTEPCIEYGPWLSMSHSNHMFGDEEPIHKLIDFSGLCQNPLSIQCREVISRLNYTQTGQNVICDLEHGLLCRNSDQASGSCMNYEVRIGCWSCETTTTPPLPPLPMCPETPKTLKRKCPLSCPPDHSCDGYSCVPTFDCPCFREGKKFKPGDIAITSDCHKCECILNGFSKCKPMTCPPCGKGQWSEISKFCQCECKECDFGTVLCPTNHQCISEEQWCDGIVDCPDDETDCPTQPPTLTPTTTLAPSECTLDTPSELAVCEMNVNTFRTFDGLQYQYEICDHVLTKEKSTEAFAINVHKACNESNAYQCKRYVVIHVDDLEIRMGPDSGELYFNNYRVPLTNLGLLSRKYNDFVIKKRGNHLVFRSLKYSFEVSVDSKQDVKITMSKCYLRRLAGLCGLFNDFPEDDFTEPNGVLSYGSTEFGDSWSIGDLSRCSLPICNPKVLEKSVEICKEFYNEPFSNCSIYLDMEMRVEACISFICECTLESKNKDVLESCKCSAYESFVDACEDKKNSPLTDWRIKHGCAPDCEPGLEYNECGPGCDLTCDNYHDIEKNCEERCVPGCYCPLGLVHHNGRCVKPKMCQDCVCRGHGDPNYISFDGHYYAFQGNCTYVLAQHQSGDDSLDFQVLSTNVECLEEPGTTCTDGIRVIWKGHVIEKFKGKPVMVDGVNLKASDSPYNDSGISITFVPNKSTIIHIKEINLAVRYFDQMYGYNIELPAYLYFNKTEGLCGICNFDKSDDIYHRDGYVTDNIENFAYSWLVDNVREHCTLPRIPVPSPPPYICNFTENPCDMFIDPTLYSKSCQNDISYSRKPDASMCRSKFQYAQQCCERGVPLEAWLEESGCLTSCPEDMVFKCTSACQKTCDSSDKSGSDTCDLMPLYTCTCPADKVLKNGHCVDPILCKTCEDKLHVIGDTWQIDPCENCTCTDKLSIICSKTQCPQPPICIEDEELDILRPKPDECCEKYLCKSKSRSDCVERPTPECMPGTSVVLSYDEFNCPVYKCECNLALCPPIVHPLSPEEGEIYQLETVGCCPQYVGICAPETCSAPPDCGLGFKRVEFQNKCCKKYNCVPKNNVCIYRHKYAVLNGTEVQLPEEEYYDSEYEAGSMWHDGLCRKCSCIEKNGQFAYHCEIKICIDPSKYPDADTYVRDAEFVPGACCPKYSRVKCIAGGKIYSVGEEWLSPDGDKCKKFKCIDGPHSEVLVLEQSTICDNSCPAHAIYVEADANSPKCCGHCKPVACLEDGIVHESGTRWKSHSKPCFTAECMVGENITKIIYQGKSCPMLPSSCPKEHIILDEEGCCSYCKKPTDTCNPVQIPSSETIKYFRLKHKVHGTCRNTEKLFNLTKCSGQCESPSIFSTTFDNFESSCKCCLPSSAEKRKIVLDCTDGVRVTKLYQQPMACHCTACGQDRTTIDVPPPY